MNKAIGFSSVLLIFVCANAVFAQSEGAPILLDPNSANSEDLLDDPIGFLPENITLVLQEQADERLHEEMLEGFGVPYMLAIWPDSVLVESKEGYLLLTPPSNPIDAFHLPQVINDEAGLYGAALGKSSGFLVVDMPFLLNDNALSAMVFDRLSKLQKSVLIDSRVADLASVIARTEIDIHLIDYRLDPDHQEVPLRAQWQTLLDEAQYLEDVYVSIYATPRNLKALGEVIRDQKPEPNQNESAPEDGALE